MSEPFLKTVPLGRPVALLAVLSGAAMLALRMSVDWGYPLPYHERWWLGGAVALACAAWLAMWSGGKPFQTESLRFRASFVVLLCIADGALFVFAREVFTGNAGEWLVPAGLAVIGAALGVGWLIRK